MKNGSTAPLVDSLTGDSENDVREQRAILKKCLAGDVPLHQELLRRGWSYDDLRYERSRAVRPIKDRSLTLESLSAKPNGIPVVSFFAGAGGMDIGFEAAGFEHLAAVELNETFAETLRHNRPTWTVIGPPNSEGNISEPDHIASDLRPHLSGQTFDGVFIGGPPCQPFSVAANQRFKKSGRNFKRVGFAHETHGNLLFDYVWLIKRFKPKAFLIENVPGLVEIDGGEQIKRAIRTLEGAGYCVNAPRILDASHFGVAQHRRRVFIIGTRAKVMFSFPLPAGHTAPCGPLLARPIRGCPNHVTRLHSAASIARYMRLWYGDREPLGRVDRLDPMRPSKTVIAGGVSGGGRSHLHPEIPRTLTVRECARLQTFPDDYEFTGPSARQFTQVGNAVPPVLAAQLGLSLRKALGSWW